MDGKRLVVFAGQLEADDFPPSILASFGSSARDHPDACLVIVGDGPSRTSLETEAHRVGIEKQCQFTGYIPRQEVQALLSLATLFLFPLRDDLMSRCKSPLVVVEALSHGIPVVGSAVGEVPRMVGDAGILLPTLEPADWTRALESLLAEPGRAQELGRMARQRFEAEWTWKRSVDHLERAYRTALAGGEG
jgi:glycosyltransferase involved in cell wall biosynthesis